MHVIKSLAPPAALLKLLRPLCSASDLPCSCSALSCSLLLSLCSLSAPSLPPSTWGLVQIYPHSLPQVATLHDVAPGDKWLQDSNLDSLIRYHIIL